MAIWQASGITSVNVGASANDGTGDDVRDAFIKIDNNINNLSAFLSGASPYNSSDFVTSNITTLSSNTGSITSLTSQNIIGNIASFVGTTTTGLATVGNLTATSAIFAPTSVTSTFLGPVTLSGSTVLNGNVTTNHDIIPGANLVYNLGSPTNWFNSAYIQHVNQINTTTISSAASILELQTNVTVGSQQDVGILGKYNTGVSGPSGNNWSYFGYQWATGDFIVKTGMTVDPTIGNNIVVSGYYGNIYAGSQYLANTTASTSTSSGALIVAGGAGVAGNINAPQFNGNITSSFANIGSMTLSGNVVGNASVTGTIFSSGYQVVTTDSAGIGPLYTGGIVSGPTSFLSAVPSISTSTGAVIVPNGGLGVGGNIFAGGLVGTLYGAVATSNQPNITTVGSLGNLTVIGTTNTNSLQATSIGGTTVTATTLIVNGSLTGLSTLNISGNVTAGLIGNVYTSAQPGITSLGTLTGLGVNGVVSLGTSGALRFNATGGSGNYVGFIAPSTIANNVTWTLPNADTSVAGYALVSNGSGTLSWAPAGPTIATDTTDTTLYPTMTQLSSGNFVSARINANIAFNGVTNTLSVPKINGLSIASSTGNLTIANGMTLATSGANNITFTGASGGSNVTLPVSGTLLTSGTLGTPWVNGSLGTATATSINGLTITTTTGTLTIGSGNNLTVSGSYTLNQSVASGAAPTLTGTNFSGIPNAALNNYAVTVTAGTGMSGGGSVALGSSVTLNNAGVTGISGTTNQVSVSASTGSVTISLPQNINSGAAPTFAGTNFSGTASALSIGGSAASATSASYAGYLNNSYAYTNGTDGWFRSTGNAGWYNATYAVGIYATSSGLIQTYNSSNFQVNGTCYATAFSGAGTGLTGTASSLTAGAANSVAWSNISGIPSIAYNNGGTYGINITGTAGGVAWSNISGVPSIAYNNGQTYGISITGTAGGVAWSNISGIPSIAYNNGGTYSINISGNANSAYNITQYTINQSVGTGNGPSFAYVYAGAFYYSSDATLKTNITDLADTDKFDQLRPVTFEWLKDNKSDIGFIAQDLQKIVPDAVFENTRQIEAEEEGGESTEETTLGINITPIVAMLVRRVQTQDQKIAELEHKLSLLIAKVGE